MSQRSWTFFHSLVKQFHEGKEEAFLALLPEGEEVDAGLFDAAPSELAVEYVRPSCFLDRIHFSWLAPLVGSLDSSVQVLYSHVLDEKMGAKLRSHLSLKNQEIHLPDSVKKMARFLLFRRMVPRDFKPLSQVESKFTSLLFMDKFQLCELIDLMSVYDIAYEFKDSIDQKLLNRSFSLMAEHQRDYLKQVLRNSVEPSSLSTNLRQLVSQPEAFQNRLHKKGILRFAEVLRGESEEFFWYLCRILDTGRAAVLMRVLETGEKREDREELGRQMKHALQNLSSPKGTE